MIILANTCLRSLLVSLTLIALCSSTGSTASNDPLVDAAKREAEVVYYASMNLSEANAVIGEFEKRYPFLKVKLQRTGSEKLMTRVLTEARAKKPFADVIQTVEFSMHIFNRSGILARYTSQANEHYPKSTRKRVSGRRSTTTPTLPAITPDWLQPARCQKHMTICSIPNGRAS
ncbi:MAG TPA: extracellular solute-binding protein [Candidatus Binatia bacterium]|nr:extracellular solute-binding protein [Candidatus Binatia bacterium]